mgnify:CR=1 FL=1
MHESDPKCKALVFTQFTSSMHYVMRQVSHALLLQMLICACSQLTEAGFQARTLEGSMTLKQRKQALVRTLALFHVSLALNAGPIPPRSADDSVRALDARWRLRLDLYVTRAVCAAD